MTTTTIERTERPRNEPLTANVMRRVAENVLRFREAQGHTQASVARLAGVTVETIARLERTIRGRATANNNPCIDTLTRIATAFGVDVATLVSEPTNQRKNAVDAERRAWRLHEASRLEAEAKRLRGKS